MSEDTDTIEIDDAPATASEATEAGYEFDELFQDKIVALIVRDQSFVHRTAGLIKPEYFTDDASAFVISMIGDFYKKYRKTPDARSIMTVMNDAFAEKRTAPALQAEVKAKLRACYAKIGFTDREFVLDKTVAFAKNKAIAAAIIQSVEYHEKGNYAAIEKIMRQALQVGANEGAGAYDYFKEIDARTEYRDAILHGRIKKEGITTGFEELDRHLYHGGWGRKELSALMGAAKSGKSMSLGDFAKNASMAGHNVIIFTCEMSANIYADRLDANFSETAMMLLGSKPGIVAKAIKEAEKKAGKIKIHDFATGTLKTSMVRRILDHHKNDGIIFDMGVFDYADIMAPEEKSREMREDSRNVWVDLRAVVQDWNMAGLTGTQTNRNGAKATVAAATDVAEDYNKVRIADLMISINASEAEMKANKARLHFAASRNQKELTLDIEQNREMMRFISKVVGVRL